MSPSHKPYGSLDYPLFPRRRRPWRWLIGGGVVLGVLVFIGWQRLPRPYFLVGWDTPPARPVPAAPEPGGEQVALVHSAVVTPTVSLQLTPTILPGVSDDDFIDEVDEVELSWAERGGRTEVITYTVQTGDNLWYIADEFDLDVDTLRWSNLELEHNPDLLPVGMELVILPAIGVEHTVQAGETLASLAQRYGVAEADILNYPLNDLSSPDDLQAGQELIVPHGRKEQLAQPTPQPVPDSPFAWPLVGIITQGFYEVHQAIDIAAPYGSPVYAGRAGQVIRSGWARTGYGYTVIIDHGEGLWSLYSHMKGEWVRVGDWVERGQLIGEVGSTGNSSGPHMHFEIRVDGERVNPLDYLPPEGPR
jgi:LysM repeat protein